MTEAELDRVYSRLCNTMTAVGEPQSQQFLARFALLAICALDAPDKVEALIEDAARNFLEGADTGA